MSSKSWGIFCIEGPPPLPSFYHVPPGVTNTKWISCLRRRFGFRLDSASAFVSGRSDWDTFRYSPNRVTRLSRFSIQIPLNLVTLYSPVEAAPLAEAEGPDSPCSSPASCRNEKSGLWRWAGALAGTASNGAWYRTYRRQNVFAIMKMFENRLRFENVLSLTFL